MKSQPIGRELQGLIHHREYEAPTHRAGGQGAVRKFSQAILLRLSGPGTEKGQLKGCPGSSSGYLNLGLKYVASRDESHKDECCFIQLQPAVYHSIDQHVHCRTISPQQSHRKFFKIQNMSVGQKAQIKPVQPHHGQSNAEGCSPLGIHGLQSSSGPQLGRGE